MPLAAVIGVPIHLCSHTLTPKAVAAGTVSGVIGAVTPTDL